MNRERDPNRHRTVPEARIQILKRPGDQPEDRDNQTREFKSAEATIKRASLAQEVREGAIAFPVSLKDPESISNMTKGTTFAARARAAELNSARAAAAAKEAMTSGEDEVPEIAPVSLGSLKFTRRITQRGSRGSKSSVNLSDLATITSANNLTPPNPSNHTEYPDNPDSNPAGDDLAHQLQNSNAARPLSSQGSKPSQSVALDGQPVELNQQAIRQKVREVSVKQQSINDSNNNNHNESYRREVHDSTSLSPYSSQGSRSSLVGGPKKTELNTQHIREIQREAEKQRQLAGSLIKQSNVLTHVGNSSDVRPLARSSGTSSSDHPTKYNTISDDTSKSDTSRFHFLPAVPVYAGACPGRANLTSPNNGQRLSSNNDHSQIRNPQPLSPAQTLRINLRDEDNDMSQRAILPNKKPEMGTNFTPPRRDYNLSRQESLRSTGNPASAKRQHSNTPLAHPQATRGSVVMAENVDDSQFKSLYAQNAARFGVGVQAQPSSDPCYKLQQPEPSSFHFQSQPRGTENQSPHRQESQSTYGLQIHSVYSQQNQSTYGQTQAESHFGNMRPKAIEKFAEVAPGFGAIPMDLSGDQVNEDPFTDTGQSSSTVNPAIYRYSPAQLRVTSPAFIPSTSSAVFVPRPSEPEFVPRVQAKAPLPAVKGTDRDQHSKRQLHRPDLPPKAWNQDERRFKASTMSTTELERTKEKPRNKHSDGLVRFDEERENRKKAQESTSTTGKTPSLRDPMPYTGFSSTASKKDQLLGNLNKTIDEAKAKGDLSASNRSVLFDPVASSAGAGGSYGPSSTAATSYNLNSSNFRDPRLKPEAPVFDFPNASESIRATPEYDPNILKDSEPLPPSVRQQDIETKPLSSPEEVYGFRGHRRGYSGAVPRYPPGLSQSTNPFTDVQISNQDGLWNDSLAVNSGNPMVEEHVRTLGPKATAWVEKQTQTPGSRGNAWVEEQKLLLCHKVRPTSEKLEAAKKWLVSGQGTMEEYVKDILQRSEGLTPLPSGTRYWERSVSQEPQKTQQAEHIRTVSGSRHAPIGSERVHNLTASHIYDGTGSSINNKSRPCASIGPTGSTMSDEEIRKRAAIDVMAPVLANLASYHAGENPGPFQRYSQPPAWCIDNSEAGRKSFFNDNWGDVPKRVGRDPRYQQTMHEGRSTYFEDPNPSARRERDLPPVFKPPPGWGMNRK